MSERLGGIRVEDRDIRGRNKQTAKWGQLWPKRIFLSLGINNFRFFMSFKNIENIEFLMRMLWPLCTGWAYGSGTDANAERASQTQMCTLTKCISSFHAISTCASVSCFSNVHLYTLSVRIRKWCMHCTSGTDTYAEHSRQELMRALSIQVRNWCVHWSYSSGTDAYPAHTGQKLMHAFTLVCSRLLICIQYFFVNSADSFFRETYLEVE